jgi:putative transposase
MLAKSTKPRLKTAEGAIEYSAPPVAGREEPYRSAIRKHLKGHTQALEELTIEMLARGLSVRDIEGAFKDESRLGSHARRPSQRSFQMS